jgi:hypothetical protein
MLYSVVGGGEDLRGLLKQSFVAVRFSVHEKYEKMATK